VDTANTDVRTGLWIVAGREGALIGAATDRARYPALRQDLASIAEDLLITASDRLDTVVLSIADFEYYLIDAYRQADENAENPAREYSDPFELACDCGLVHKIIQALLRQAPHFRQLVSRCAAWKDMEAGGRGRLALLQPISANGFFSDDGSPNVDRMTGSPLVTPDGLIDDRLPGHASAFPNSDHDMRNWVPYLTADPLMAIVLREAGGFAVDCSQIEKELPKPGRSGRAASG
jgi:hypothetical protein